MKNLYYIFLLTLIAGVVSADTYFFCTDKDGNKTKSYIVRTGEVDQHSDSKYRYEVSQAEYEAGFDVWKSANSSKMNSEDFRSRQIDKAEKRLKIRQLISELTLMISEETNPTKQTKLTNIKTDLETKLAAITD